MMSQSYVVIVLGASQGEDIQGQAGALGEPRGGFWVVRNWGAEVAQHHPQEVPLDYGPIFLLTKP